MEKITPEYLGVGYIVGPKIGGVLVAGSVLCWFVFIPLLASLVDPMAIATQLHKIGYLKDLAVAGGAGNWDPVNKTFGDFSSGYLSRLRSPDRCGCSSSRWFHHADQNHPNYHLFIQRQSRFL